jgi:hypothetical protein
MSCRKLIPSLLVATLALGMTTAPAKAQIDLGSGIVINNVDLQGVNYDAATGLLTAASGTVSGTLGGFPFTTDIENFAVQLMPDANPSGGCSVLDLSLAPINLALLGLHVDTSPICLSITAFEGQGLLGDLLCGLAGGDTSLLGGLGDLLTDVLNGVLADPGTDPVPHQAEGDVCSGECDVLPLSLGPVDLTLLGLNVHLDDCSDGPVQVCVSATASEGLLGGLLCGLAGGPGITSMGVVEDLVGTVTSALGGTTLTAKQTKQLTNRLVGQVSDRLQDGVLSAADLDKVTKTITSALR